MTSMSTSRSMWSVDSRTIVYAAIGAALYGVLLVAQIPMPGTKDVSIRPAFALVPFFGYAFGPVVGFFTGFVGNAVGDQISGWGLLTSWNWSIANGLAGFLAGLAPLYLASLMRGSLANRAIAAAIAGVVGVLIGFLFVFTDMSLSGYDVNTVVTTEYGPVIIGNLVATIILVPILTYAWEPVKERMGR